MVPFLHLKRMPCEGFFKVRSMKSIACPFCGMAADVPHNTQEACIEALHQEILRTRKFLEHTKALELKSSEMNEQGPEVV